MVQQVRHRDVETAPQAARSVTTYRVGKLIVAASPMLCLVRNLSDFKATIDIDLPFGDRAEAVLEIGRERLSGALTRIGETRAELHSEDPIDLDTILADPAAITNAGRRTLPRIAVAARARIDIGANRIPVTVSDISTDGVKIFCEELLSIGDEVRVVLRAIERPMPGVVRWTGGDYAGIEFLQRLPIGAVNAWLAENAGPDAESEPAWTPPVISKS